MSSLTIHSIDPTLKAALDREASRRGTSKNQLVKDLLARDLGVSTAAEAHSEYREFCGLWTEEDARDFTRIQESNEHVDLSEWQD